MTIIILTIKLITIIFLVKIISNKEIFKCPFKNKLEQYIEKRKKIKSHNKEQIERQKKWKLLN